MSVLSTAALSPRRTLVLVLAVSALGFTVQDVAGQNANRYKTRKFVSNGFTSAVTIDEDLVNPWGIASSPNGPWWVANNGTGVATIYDRTGDKQSLVVALPSDGSPDNVAHPTGVVFNSTDDFPVTDGNTTAPAQFIFVTLEGTIVGWNPNVPASDPSTPSDTAQLAVNNTNDGSSYTGVAIGKVQSGNSFQNRVYAANFGLGTIDMFDDHFDQLDSSGMFQDNHIPSTFAPFNITNIDGKLFVAFAKKADDGDEQAGAHLGFVDVFNTDGTLEQRLIRRGRLNAPWAMVVAPNNFGRFSNALLVGNFGNGRINAFNVNTGHLIGTLRKSNGDALVLDRLWGMAFGNGDDAGARNSLFFASGPNDETDGLFGRIRAVNPNANLVEDDAADAADAADVDNE